MSFAFSSSGADVSMGCLSCSKIRTPCENVQGEIGGKGGIEVNEAASANARMRHTDIIDVSGWVFSCGGIV